ncbi:unnamed protein product [Symbiodinium natans]|uniref:Uncharacterized protein n=1 Tax=Symbiodinium natans TaxID=878477 RepID=A0A812QAA5_9DINO|nr:unnamed protein product [Symbiodinium natans]
MAAAPVAASPAQPGTDQSDAVESSTGVEFRLCGVLLQREKEELPMSIEALMKLAEILPCQLPVLRQSDAKVAAKVVGPGGGPPNFFELEANLNKFWEANSGSTIDIDVKKKKKKKKKLSQNPELRRRLCDSGFGVAFPCFGVLLALLTGNSFGLLPREVATAVKLLQRTWGSVVRHHDDNAPLQQMTTFAAATVAATSHAEDGYLNALFMEDARSYLMDSMETSKIKRKWSDTLLRVRTSLRTRPNIFWVR